MIVWVESHSPFVIALIVFGVSYLVVGLVLLGMVALSSRPVGRHLKATTPSMLGPLSLIAGLLLVFLATRVWNTFDRASTYVTQEASAVRAALIASEGLPPEVRGAVRSRLTDYVQFVVDEDWPAMVSGRPGISHTPDNLIAALHGIFQFNATTNSEQLAQQRLAEALERTAEARSHRIMISRATIAPIQWDLVILLEVFILITVGMVHIEWWVTTWVNMMIFGTAYAACLVLLMVYDRPFSAGGFTLQPVAFYELSASK